MICKLYSADKVSAVVTVGGAEVYRIKEDGPLVLKATWTRKITGVRCIRLTSKGVFQDGYNGVTNALRLWWPVMAIDRTRYGDGCKEARVKA